MTQSRELAVTDQSVGAAALPLEPSEEERLLRESVRRIAESFGPAYFQQIVEDGQPARKLWNALGDGGFLGVNLPEEYGGGGLGVYELAVVVEEASKAGVPLLTALYSPGVIGAILNAHGSDQQKREFLPGIASGEKILSFAITEPDAGTNSYRITTAARRVGDSYVINGQKYYITGMESADHVMVVARTGIEEGTGRAELSLFLLDADQPGITRHKIPTVMRMPEGSWHVFFDDVKVPAERRVGPEGRGLAVAFAGLNVERILTSSLCTGVGRYALAKAVAYASERSVWGTPIGAHQAISHPLAEAKIHLESATLMTHRACRLYDCGRDAGEASNMAKLLGADAGIEALDHAIQTHGGNGVALEYRLATYFFIVRMLKIGPVSREMILNFIAERSLGLPRSY
jgi:alkylation response protein AidB-like acyl-CoA dehydrogenase